METLLITYGLITDNFNTTFKTTSWSKLTVNLTKHSLSKTLYRRTSMGDISCFGATIEIVTLQISSAILFHNLFHSSNRDRN